MVTGTCLADAGNHVVCVDIDAEKVAGLSRGVCPIYEPGLEELIKANLAATRLRFTTDLPEGVAHGQVVFIAVGTPPAADGSADLSGVEAIIRQVARLMTCPKVVVIKSTVPVGTGRRMSELMADLTAHPFAVVSNPEFLREGAAVEDFLRPDRIIIGCDGDDDAVQLMTELYAPFAQTSPDDHGPQPRRRRDGQVRLQRVPGHAHQLRQRDRRRLRARRGWTSTRSARAWGPTAASARTS